jgi:hypothetical protein
MSSIIFKTSKHINDVLLNSLPIDIIVEIMSYLDSDYEYILKKIIILNNTLPLGVKKILYDDFHYILFDTKRPLKDLTISLYDFQNIKIIIQMIKLLYKEHTKIDRISQETKHTLECLTHQPYMHTRNGKRYELLHPLINSRYVSRTQTALAFLILDYKYITKSHLRRNWHTKLHEKEPCIYFYAKERTPTIKEITEYQTRTKNFNIKYCNQHF